MQRYQRTRPKYNITLASRMKGSSCSHLWPIVVDCDLHVAIGILSSKKASQRRLNRDEELARLKCFLVCPNKGISDQDNMVIQSEDWVLTTTASPHRSDNRHFIVHMGAAGVEDL